MVRIVRLATLPLLCLALLTGCQVAPRQDEAPVSSVPAVTPAPAPVAEPRPEVQPEPQPQPAAQPATPVEVKEPEPTPPVVVCEPPPTPPPAAPAPPARPTSVLPILGAEEIVAIEPPGVRLKARLDTGTGHSTLDARNVREFERDGKPWVRFMVPGAENATPVEVSRPVLRSSPVRSGGRRYVVSLRTQLGSIDQFTEFTLSDRSDQGHAVILGRNFLRDQALVDVAKRFTVPAAKH